MKMIDSADINNMNTVPLPSGPSTLCFNKDDFMKVISLLSLKLFTDLIAVSCTLVIVSYNDRRNVLSFTLDTRYVRNVIWQLAHQNMFMHRPSPVRFVEPPAFYTVNVKMPCVFSPIFMWRNLLLNVESGLIWRRSVMTLQST